jgi:hypothetical protein
LPTDFHPGCSILENITETITKSYKVILILTDHFINSKWCEYEADQALIVRLLETNQNCVIPIILEKCEIPNKLKHLTYLDLTLENCGQRQKYFHSSQNSLYYYLCSQYSVKYVVGNIL